MNIRVRGISYFIKKHQSNPTLPSIVFLHGFLGSGESFAALISKISSFCNPITIDLLGHGNTEGAELYYRFSTKEQVADLSKLIQDQLDVPIGLYGYSMGARLALQLAIQHPKLFSLLILESGTFGIEHDSERQARQALDAARSDQIVGNYTGFLNEWRSLDMFSKTHDLHSIQESQNPYWMSNSLLGFGSGSMPCVRAHLNRIQSPTLLIAGESDQKFIRINQTMKKEISDSTLEIISNAKHRVHVDNPEYLGETLKTFLNKNLTS